MFTDILCLKSFILLSTYLVANCDIEVDITKVTNLFVRSKFCSKYLCHRRPKQKRCHCDISLLRGFAERRGFEPLKPFWGLLAFQAGQFNHSCISPFVPTKILFFAKFYNKMRVSMKILLTSHNEQSKWIKL